MSTETHLSIVWSAARASEKSILSELGKNFKILKVYEVHWREDSFINNLQRFYSHSQFNLKKRKLKRLMSSKAKHCGKAPFLVIVFEDLKPTFQNRPTSSGYRRVNSNVFDFKQKLRSDLGGGHIIHATDSVKETNKDLTLLTGLNLQDFKKINSDEWSGRIDKIENNVFGFNGFKDISELFYLLNSTLDYVVLRNFEEFPDKIVLNEHSDVDLLVENKNILVYTVGAEPVFFQNYRVHYTIIIGGKKVPFDIRYIGDDYFDKQWQIKVLKSKVFEKNTFYRPNQIEYFYSLLYHALIHKPSFSKDYKSRLNRIGDQIEKIRPTMQSLKAYMIQNNYRFCEPKDFSVYYNINSSKINFKRKVHCIYLPKLKRSIKKFTKIVNH